METEIIPGLSQLDINSWESNKLSSIFVPGGPWFQNNYIFLLLVLVDSVLEYCFYLFVVIMLLLLVYCLKVCFLIPFMLDLQKESFQTWLCRLAFKIICSGRFCLLKSKHLQVSLNFSWFNFTVSSFCLEIIRR